MVRVTDTASTVTLLRKYCPMWPWVHARAKLPQRSEPGRPHGSDRISASSLKELATTQTSGTAVTRPQKTRAACGKGLSAKDLTLSLVGCADGAWELQGFTP